MAVNLIWLSLSCVGLTVVSAILPWVNAEVILLSIVAMTRSAPDAAVIVLAATFGQMAGKCVVYWTSRAVRPQRSPRIAAALARFQRHVDDKPFRATTLLFVSSAVGIPPFYAATVAAGALQIDFGRFLLAGTVGRLVRFSALALVPKLVM